MHCTDQVPGSEVSSSQCGLGSGGAAAAIPSGLALEEGVVAYAAPSAGESRYVRKSREECEPRQIGAGDSITRTAGIVPCSTSDGC